MLTADKMPEISSSVDLIPAPINVPSKSVTKNKISNPADGGHDPVINLDDSSSGGSLDVGGF